MKESVLLQALPSVEIRAVRTACLLLDNVALHTAPMEGIPNFRSHLERGEMMPVGTVEFVMEAMSVAGIEPPPAPGFPPELQPFLYRPVTRTTLAKLASVRAPTFIKPVATKLFNGFVFNPATPPQDLDAHDQEQLAALERLDISTAIWASPVVNFVSEWRYYVLNGLIAGQARYDPEGHENAPAPDRCEVERAIHARGQRHPYAIDFGVLATGETALVEVHDAWAIGLYGHALNPKDYYRFLRTYWDHLLHSQARFSE